MPALLVNPKCKPIVLCILKRFFGDEKIKDRCITDQVFYLYTTFVLSLW